MGPRHQSLNVKKLAAGAEKISGVLVPRKRRDEITGVLVLRGGGSGLRI